MTYKQKLFRLINLFDKENRNKKIKRFNFLEILIEVSFKTKFEVWYSDEFNVMQKISVEGFKYSKLIYIGKEFDQVEIRVFVQNLNHYSGENLCIKLIQDSNTVSVKFFSISNYLLYDGWFFFEKKI